MHKIQQPLRRTAPNQPQSKWLGPLRHLAYSLLLVSSLLLTSCSSTKLAYEYLDWVAMWKIDRLVNLDPERRERVKAAVDKLHHWHRKTQLPRYADYLEDLQKRLQPGSVTAQWLHDETDKVQLMLDDSLERLLPPAVDIVANFTDDQVIELLHSIAEERQEYVDEYIKPGVEERQEKSAEEFKDRARRFIGRLTQQQADWVEAWSKDMRPYAEASARQQALWQEHLTKYLAQRNDKEFLEQGLRELMLYRTDNWHPELQEIMDENQAMTYELIAKILNNLTDTQQDHLHRRLQKYVKEFRELAAR